MPFDIEWVVLTMGDRPEALDAAVRSLIDDAESNVGVVVVSNGGGAVALPDDPRIRLVELDDNLGIPGGRDAGLRRCDAPIVGFLDDDAIAPAGASDRILEEFASDRRLGGAVVPLVDGSASARRGAMSSALWVGSPSERIGSGGPRSWVALQQFGR